MKTILTVLFISIKSHAMWSMVKDTTDKMFNVELLSEAIIEVAEQSENASNLITDIESIRKTIWDTQNELLELEYTHEEINELIGPDLKRLNTLTDSLFLISKTMKKGKDLTKRIALMTGANPDTITASEAIRANQNLNEINNGIQEMRNDSLRRDLSQKMKELREFSREQKRKKAIRDELLKLRVNKSNPFSFGSVILKEKKENETNRSRPKESGGSKWL